MALSKIKGNAEKFSFLNFDFENQSYDQEELS